MKLVFYTTHCPACNILEKKLKAAGLEYITVEDPNKIIELGFFSAPILTVDENPMTLRQACNWIEKYERGEVK